MPYVCAVLVSVFIVGREWTDCDAVVVDVREAIVFFNKSRDDYSNGFKRFTCAAVDVVCWVRRFFEALKLPALIPKWNLNDRKSFDRFCGRCC